MFLASRANNKIIEFSGTLGKIREIDTSAFLQAPVGVAFGPNGHLYLTSDTQDKVVEIDSTGASVAPDPAPAPYRCQRGSRSDPKEIYL